ncbi:hypothetical protein ACFLTS_01395 [Chloroflexota bacterium]
MPRIDDGFLRDQRRLEKIVPSVRKNCPRCGGRLHISGNAQRLDYRFVCTSCDYSSPILSQDELDEVL